VTSIEHEGYPLRHGVSFALEPQTDTAESQELISSISDSSRYDGLRLAQMLGKLGNDLSAQARFGGSQLILPDDQTHIVAVLGTNDTVTDDWFASDFCLLHRIFGRTARTEIWHTCVSLMEHVKKYGAIKHGNPNNPPRRIVFDADTPVFYTQGPPETHAITFLNSVRRVASAAQPGERIVVIVAAHGDVSGDVEIGTMGSEHHEAQTMGGARSRERKMSRTLLESALAVAQDGVRITIISTACFSGLWLVPWNHRETTIIAAAPADKESWSYSASNSSGFCRGGYFTGSLAEEMSKLAIPQTTPSAPETLRIAEPASLHRAISVGDLGKRNKLMPGPLGGIASFCVRMQDRFRNHPLVRLPQPAIATTDVGRSAANVLGGDGEISTLFRVEGILSLQPEDPFSVVTLGVENTKKSGGTASSSAYVGAARYLLERTTLLSGSPEDNHVIKMVWFLDHGQLPEQDIMILWRVLAWRWERDCWAETVVRQFTVDFAPVRTWTQIQGYPLDARYIDAMMPYLRHHPFMRSSSSYNRPIRYIQAAATKEGITPAKLISCLAGGVEQDTLEKGPLDVARGGPAGPVIPLRKSSLQTQSGKIYGGNWSAISVIESLQSDSIHIS
jgi:hypothetical protein